MQTTKDFHWTLMLLVSFLFIGVEGANAAVIYETQQINQYFDNESYSGTVELSSEFQAEAAGQDINAGFLLFAFEDDIEAEFLASIPGYFAPSTPGFLNIYVDDEQEGVEVDVQNQQLSNSSQLGFMSSFSEGDGFAEMDVVIGFIGSFVVGTLLTESSIQSLLSDGLDYDLEVFGDLSLASTSVFFDVSDVTPSASVPEPAAFILLAMALIGLRMAGKFQHQRVNG